MQKVMVNVTAAQTLDWNIYHLYQQQTRKYRENKQTNKQHKKGKQRRGRWLAVSSVCVCVGGGGGGLSRMELRNDRGKSCIVSYKQYG